MLDYFLVSLFYNTFYYVVGRTGDDMASGPSTSEYKLPKHLLSQSDKFSKEKMDLETKLDAKKKEVQEKQKKILELQDKVREFSQMESQLAEKIRRLGTSNKERDILEKELITTRSELASIKRTLGDKSLIMKII